MITTCTCNGHADDRYLGVTQISALLGLHPHTVRKLVREGRLPALRAGGQLRIRVSDLSALAV